jgi:conjugal transfer ATP-binding protein TraC
MFGLKEDKAERNLNDVVPILRIEKDLIILKDGRVAAGFEIQGSPFEGLSDVQYESFCKAFETSSLTLPFHYIIQKIDVYAPSYYPNGRKESDGKEVGFFEKENIKHFSDNPVLRQKSYLFIISNTAKNVKHNPFSTYYSANLGLFDKTFKGLELRIEQVKQYGKGFVESIISSANIQARAMNGESLRDLYYQMLNLEFKEKVTEPYKSILNNQNALVIGEKKVNVISLNEQGSDIFYSVPNYYGVDSPYTWSLGLYLQCPHITVTSWYIDDTKAVLSSLDNQKRINSAMTKLSGQEAVAKLDELEAFTMEMRQTQERFISVSLQVIIYTNGEAAREKNIQLASDAIRSIYGAKPLVETFDNTNIYFASLPGAAGGNLRWVLMKSAEASSYANFSHEFISRKQGDYVADRFRNQVYISLFNRDLNNQNALVIGPSGSGKSFTIGYFVVQRFERKERQIIIDVGGSYKNLIETVGGKYLEYDPENPISFNPFLCPQDASGNYIANEDKVGFIISLINLLWKEKDKSIDNVEWAIFQDLIPRFFKAFNEQNTKSDKKEVPNLSRFIVWLKVFEKDIKEDKSLSSKFERFDLVGLHICLEPFVAGKYKQLLNSENVLDISDHRLVCFDMARVKDDKRLYPIVAMLLTELSLDTIRKFPNEIKYFTMDEAWSMLSEAMGEFVEYMYRTLRKNNGSMTIITQGIDEIINSKVGTAIINNAESKMILNHTDKTQVEKLGKHLGFTTEEMNKIFSIRVNKECREVFLKQGNDSFVFVLEVPTSEHAILTSNPVERNHLAMLKKVYGGNIEFATKQWEEDKRNGNIGK